MAFTPPDSDFAAPEVLRWKYLDADDGAIPARTSMSPAELRLRDESGRIIGHLGLCRTAFEGPVRAPAGGRVGTIHIIDWLGSPSTRRSG